MLYTDSALILPPMREIGINNRLFLCSDLSKSGGRAAEINQKFRIVFHTILDLQLTSRFEATLNQEN